MEGKGEETPENVVRFPRDWVGPLEDLVPIGTRARARDDSSGPSGDDEAPISGDSFWSESTVQEVIQGPARQPDATPGQPEAAPVAARHPRGRRPRLPHRHVGLRWPAVVAVAVVAAVIAVAAIGLTEGSAPTGSRQTATQDASVGGSSAPRSRGTAARSSNHIAKRPTRHARVRPHRAATKHAAPHRATKQSARHTTPVRHHTASRAHHSSRGAARHAAAKAVHQVTTVTVQAPTPTTEAPAATSSSPPPAETTPPSEPVGTSASGSAGSGSAPAAPAGPTGVGSAVGCSPKCS
jgi:hypothetical protein